jgi:hypothetical protein
VLFEGIYCLIVSEVTMAPLSKIEAPDSDFNVILAVTISDFEIVLVKGLEKQLKNKKINKKGFDFNSTILK